MKTLQVKGFQTTEFENITGKGLKAELNGSEVLAGNLALIESFGIDVDDETVDKYHELESLSKTIIFIAEA